VFIPELHADDYWIPRTMRDSYMACMTRLHAAMQLMAEGAEREKREDAYSVVNDFVGLKLRVRAAHSTTLCVQEVYVPLPMCVDCARRAVSVLCG
jgi:hypothetical protein